jgi:hypothetical protein
MTARSGKYQTQDSEKEKTDISGGALHGIKIMQGEWIIDN